MDDGDGKVSGGDDLCTGEPMKIVEQTPTKLILRKDANWIKAIIALIFDVILGLFLVYVGIVNLFSGVDTIIYIFAIICGVFCILLSPVLSSASEEEKVTCSFDITLDCMILERRSIFGTKVINLPLHKISKVIVTEHTKTSPRTKQYSTAFVTSTSYKISLLIKASNRIRLCEEESADSSSQLAECIAEFIQIPLNTPF